MFERSRARKGAVEAPQRQGPLRATEVIGELDRGLAAAALFVGVLTARQPVGLSCCVSGPLARLVKKLRQIPPRVRLGTGRDLLGRSLDDDPSSAFAPFRT